MLFVSFDPTLSGPIRKRWQSWSWSIDQEERNVKKLLSELMIFIHHVVCDILLSSVSVFMKFGKATATFEHKIFHIRAIRVSAYRRGIHRGWQRTNTIFVLEETDCWIVGKRSFVYRLCSSFDSWGKLGRLVYFDLLQLESASSNCIQLWSWGDVLSCLSCILFMKHEWS